jgi:hypothetical protein
MRTFIVAVGGGAFRAGALPLAAPAQADPTCSYFGSAKGGGVCGAPDLNGPVANAKANLEKDSASTMR